MHALFEVFATAPLPSRALTASAPTDQKVTRATDIRPYVRDTNTINGHQR